MVAAELILTFDLLACYAVEGLFAVAFKADILGLQVVATISEIDGDAKPVVFTPVFFAF